MILLDTNVVSEPQRPAPDARIRRGHRQRRRLHRCHRAGPRLTVATPDTAPFTAAASAVINPWLKVRMHARIG